MSLEDRMNLIELAGNEGWWTDSDSVDHAQQWLDTFKSECGNQWIEPVTAECVPFDDQDISIEWKHNDRILTIIVNQEEAYCGQSHESTGRHDALKFANTPEERAALWAWLTEEAAIIESLKHIQWIPTNSSEPCEKCEQAKREAGLDLAGALRAMADFERSMLTLQTNAGTAAANIAPISEGILKLAKENNNA